jgi:hypothetical protein
VRRPASSIAAVRQRRQRLPLGVADGCSSLYRRKKELRATG